MLQKIGFTGKPHLDKPSDKKRMVLGMAVTNSTVADDIQDILLGVDDVSCVVQGCHAYDDEHRKYDFVLYILKDSESLRNRVKELSEHYKFTYLIE